MGCVRQPLTAYRKVRLGKKHYVCKFVSKPRLKTHCLKVKNHNVSIMGIGNIKMV